MGLIIWNICLTALILYLMAVLGKLIEQVEAIKTWIPFLRKARNVVVKDLGE